MSLTSQVARNTILQVVGKALTTLLGLVVVALLQRYLGPSGFGQYWTIISYLGFFSVVADLGLYLIVVREISKKEADPQKVVGNVFSIRTIFAILILGLSAIIGLFLPYPHIVKIGILLGTLSFFFVAMTQVLVGIFQKNLVMKKLVIGEIVGRIVLLILVFIFLKLKLSLLAIILAVVLGSFANFLLIFIFANQYVKIKFLFDFAYWRYILSETWPLAISVILNLIYFKIDSVFLSLMKSSEAVGLYGAAYKILEVLVTLPNMFVGLVLPILSYYAFLNREKFVQVFKKAFDLLIMAGLPLVVGGLFLAKPLVILIGGKEFSAAAPIFQILIFAIGALFLGSLSGHTIVAINKQRQMVFGYLTVAILGVILYLILIPPFSYYGAAIGTVITECSIATIGYVIILRFMKFRLPYKLFLKSLLASLIMAGFLYFMKEINILIQMVVAGGIYLIVLYLIKGFTKELILEILSSKKEGSATEIYPE